jgi:hypothetical protein
MLLEACDKKDPQLTFNVIFPIVSATFSFSEMIDDILLEFLFEVFIKVKRFV